MFKRKCVVIALLALAGNSAYALDSMKVQNADVQLYGRVDSGIDYTSNLQAAGVQGNRWQVGSNQWGTSYWGINVNFPLDNDWKAVAKLESGFGAANGGTNNNGTLFNRYSYVGIESAKYGRLTAGNHMWIANDVWDIDPMGQQWIGVDSLVGGRNWGNGPNTIQYVSPVFSGFQGAYMHMAGGTVGSTTRGSGDGISLSFSSQGLKVRAIADALADQFGRYSGGSTYGLGSSGAWNFTKEVIVGASYEIGSYKAFAGYNHITAPDANYGVSGGTYDNEATQTWLGLNYNFNEKLTGLLANYNLKEDVSGKKSNILTGGVNYDWNKNFKLFGTVGYIKNNTINSATAAFNGGNDHALYYWDTVCTGGANSACNGGNSVGLYTGFVLSF